MIQTKEELFIAELRDLLSKYLESINYTHCCKSDSKLLKIPKTTKEQRVQLNEGYNRK